MSSWQDRRGLSQPGREVHEPSGRKSSFSKQATAGGLSTLIGNTGDHASKLMYKSGKEVHEPSRKMSGGAAGTVSGKVADMLAGGSASKAKP